jgi:phosphoribosylglycinamide formyltransferase-1
VNIAVLASGSGTNFEAIAKAIKRGYIKADLKLLLTDKNDAYVRVRAEKFKIKDIFINPGDFKSRLNFDKTLVKLLRKEKVGLVVLAGFMRILTPYFVKAFRGRVINIHPAILPAFRGERSIERAYKYGCKVSGVTVHFVDEKVDHGPIILQEAIVIKEGMGLTDLERQTHLLEHKLYPLAIKLIVEKRVQRKGRYVKIC